jgi:hypothetical protein
VSSFGIPSETNNPASQIVPVVPRLAPRTAAIAAGSGTAPEATNAMIAVVDRLELCQASVSTIAPKNIKIGLAVNHSKCFMFPIAFIPPENILRPT